MTRTTPGRVSGCALALAVGCGSTDTTALFTGTDGGRESAATGGAAGAASGGTGAMASGGASGSGTAGSQSGGSSGSVAGGASGDGPDAGAAGAGLGGAGDDGASAGAGGAAGSGGPGIDPADLVCLAEADAVLCIACCNDHRPDAYLPQQVATRECICASPGPCAAECLATWCQGGPPDSPACYTCLVPHLSVGAACYAPAIAACGDDLECARYVECRAACTML